VTLCAKFEAASNPEGLEWRVHHIEGALCAGTCEGSPCASYDSAIHPGFDRFDRPSNMSSACQWFPVDRTLPGSGGVDFAAVMVYANVAAQVGCGVFLVFFGTLGDFGANRKRLMRLGWVVFAFSPILGGALVTNHGAYPWSAALLAATIVAHLGSQQMYDAYLPLLAKSHPRVLAVARGERDPAKKQRDRDRDHPTHASDDRWPEQPTAIAPWRPVAGISGGWAPARPTTMSGAVGLSVGLRWEGGRAPGGIIYESGESERGSSAGFPCDGDSSLSRHRDGGGSSSSGRRENEENGVVDLASVDVEAGGGLSRGDSERETEDPRSRRRRIRHRVERTRQKVATELAYVAPTLGFVCMLTVALLQLGAVQIVGTHHHRRITGLRIAVIIAGAWAAAFGARAMVGIRTRPLPEYAGGARSSAGSSAGSSLSSVANFFRMVFSVARRGASRTALSVRLLRKHHLELVRLLVGQTLSAIMNGSVVASYTTFVQRELNAGATDLAVIILLTAMTGAISLRVFMPLISRLTPGRLRLAMLLSKAATPAWPLWACFGMRRKWEIFLLPVAGAMVNSQILPMIRTIFQQCLPHGFEASLFSLLGVCTVAFTWIGSLIIGALLAATGSLRWGMLAVSAFGFLGVAVLSRFDFEAAMESRRKIEAWVGADGSEFAELRTNPGVGFGNAESREEEHIGEGDDAAPREGGKKTVTTLKTGRADA